AERVKTRYTPELRFEIDRGPQKSAEAARILREVLNESSESEDETDSVSTTDDAAAEPLS
ncbi:MAG: hypothetical protein KDA77_21895, partial [Planctomycetaceae bacterium]|nr:hypothetical protein [Planctomycetaceae bacterium]